MLVLRVLSRGELHGWGITLKLEQLSKSALQVDEGSLYPALYRMEEKGWDRGRVEDDREQPPRESITRP